MDSNNQYYVSGGNNAYYQPGGNQQYYQQGNQLYYQQDPQSENEEDSSLSFNPLEIGRAHV